jgi:CheY-like chemotaxis protein
LALRYEVIEALDGREVLEMLDDLEPDCAILAPGLPRADGFEVCLAIRRHERFRTIPVIFLCTSAQEDCLKRSYEVGGNLFLTKPVEAERLLRNVELSFEKDVVRPSAKKYNVEELKRMERRKLLEEIRRHKADSLRARRDEPPAADPLQPPPAREKVASTSVESGSESSSLSEASPPPSRKPRRRASASPELCSPPSASAAVAEDEESVLPRIMIVDDDDDARGQMDRALRKRFEVTTVCNGVEALEKFPEHEPDILILDIVLPRLNGCQLLQRLRKAPRFHAMPIVVVTAKTTDRDRRYVQQLGATDFIAKPFQEDDLIASIETIVSLPTFRAAPKTLGIEEIIEREYLRAKDRMDLKTMADRRQKFAELQELLKIARPDGPRRRL